MAILRRSKDRKVTNGVSPNGKTATIANSFGLPSGKAFSCPGATSVCEKVCYAGKLEKIYSGVRDVLLSNWEAIRNASFLDTRRLLLEMIKEFEEECDAADAKNAKKGKPPVERAFRIHWDGDFFSYEYAVAWANVIAIFPNIHFWVYTRSFTPILNVLPAFATIGDRDNLSLYLSVDRDNVSHATRARREFPFTKWAWLAETFSEGREEMPEVNGRTYNCPENAGRIPLISEKGSACIRCGICPNGRGDVVFSIRKR